MKLPLVADENKSWVLHILITFLTLLTLLALIPFICWVRRDLSLAALFLCTTPFLAARSTIR